MAARAADPLDLEFPQLRRPVRWRRWLGLSIPLAIAVVFVLAGALADVLAPHDPSFIDLAARLTPPVFDGGTWNHPLGTDDAGRDILSRLMHGARISLIVVGIVVPGSAAFGTLVGMTSGWLGGATGQSPDAHRGCAARIARHSFRSAAWAASLDPACAT